MTSIRDRIGISTHFMPSTHGEDIHDAIRLVSEAGFAGFEIVPTLDQAQLGYPTNYANVGIDLFEATPDDIRELKHALSGFAWVTVHSPHLDWNLASANRHLRRLTREYYDRCYDLAVELGAAAMTYHMGGATRGFVREHEAIMAYNLAYAEHLVARADGFVPLGYEAGGLDDLAYVCDRVEGWGINLDIGHAYMAGHTDANFFRYLDRLGHLIVEVHMNGVNHYWGRYMEHQPVHLNNMIDYQTTFTRLRELGYEGPIVCEIQGHDIAQVIRHCAQAQDMIVGIWDGTRPLQERWNLPAEEVL